MRNVVIFGDSILRAIYLNDGKYVISQSVAWDKIEEILNVKITNLSRMGSTVTHGRQKIFDYLQKNAANIDRVILEYGGNDSDYDWQTIAQRASKGYLPKTEHEEFESSLREIIEYIRTNYKHIDITMMTLPPIHAVQYFKWFTRNNTQADNDNIMYFIGDIEIIYRRQEMYSGIVTKVAYSYGLDLVDVRFKFLSHPDFTSLICEDGIHPNEAGEDLIVQSFLEYYKKINTAE